MICQRLNREIREVAIIALGDGVKSGEGSSMGFSLNGGCACGSIRYVCRSKPVLQYKCHCRACQRASGSGFVALFWVPSDKLELTADEPRYYAVEADSGRQLKRGFCPKCGSNVLLQPDFPDIIFIVAASLDDPSEFKPQQAIWTSSAQPWDMLDTSLQQFDQQFTPEDLQQLVHF